MHNNLYLSSRQQKYVDALIPYAIRNKLNVGFAKLANEVDLRLRHIITGEVKRRIAPATKGVDISFFAKYPTTTINIGKFDLELDKIGEIVLQKELKRYNQKYTVGVQEALVDTERYNTTYKKDLRENIGDAFQLNSVSYHDLAYGNDESIKPSFSIEIEALSPSTTLSVISFRDDKIEVMLPHRTPLPLGTELVVKIPSSRFTEGKEIVLQATLSQTMVADKGKRCTALCTLQKAQTMMSVNAFKAAIAKSKISNPMAKEQEVARTAHTVMRDLVFANSPWFTMFCLRGPRCLTPHSVIMTEVNQALYHRVVKKGLFSDPGVFKRICRELLLTSECYVFAIEYENSDQYQYIATLNELVKTTLLLQFMDEGRKRKRVSIFQCRQSLVDKNTLRNAAKYHELSKVGKTELAQLHSSIFVRDITSDVDHLETVLPVSHAPLLDDFKVSNVTSPVVWVFNNADFDNNEEARYAFEKEVIIKNGLFSRVRGVSKEISCKGVVVSLTAPLPDQLIGQDIILSMPTIGIPWTKFKLVHRSKDRLTLRFEAHNKRKIDQIETLVNKNKVYFSERNLTQQRKEIYRCLWELGVRSAPYISVLCRSKSKDKLFQAFKKSSPNDYQGFSRDNNFSLYGLLADKGAETPRSGILASLLSGASMTRSIAEWKVKNTQAYIQVRDIEYKHPKMKNEIVDLATNKTYTYTQLVSKRVAYRDIPMLEERYQWLSSIDTKEMQSLKKRVKDITHVVYLASLSSLHKAFMIADAKHQTMNQQMDSSHGE